MELSILEKKPTMSSLEIAKLTGKDHADVLKDIRRILVEAEIDAGQFSSVYKGGNGQERPCFNIPRRECDLVISGYSVKYRLAIIDRWSELEQEKIKPVASIEIEKEQDAVILLELKLKAASLFKIPEHIAQVEVVKLVKMQTDIDFTPLLLISPVQDNIKESEEFLEPTECGKRLGITAIKFNSMLEQAGLQAKVGGEWIATDKATGLFSKHQWTKKGKSGYNLKWKFAEVKNHIDTITPTK